MNICSTFEPMIQSKKKNVKMSTKGFDGAVPNADVAITSCQGRGLAGWRPACGANPMSRGAARA